MLWIGAGWTSSVLSRVLEPAFKKPFRTTQEAKEEGRAINPSPMQRSVPASLRKGRASMRNVSERFCKRAQALRHRFRYGSAFASVPLDGLPILWLWDRVSVIVFRGIWLSHHTTKHTSI